jgi:hypothetical protein
VEKLKKKYNVEKAFIVFVPQNCNSKKTFCVEDKWMITLVLNKFSSLFPEGTLILHDQHASFGGKSGKTFLDHDLFRKKDENNELLRHSLCYPAPVHQYLSCNDNGWHGPAKSKWRNEWKRIEDGAFHSAEKSVALYACLCNIEKTSLANAMKKNLFLRKKKIPSDGEIMNILASTGYAAVQTDAAYEALFVFYSRARSFDNRPGLPWKRISSLNSYLDGDYWELEK